MIHNQEDDSDAIEKFGTTDLLAGWRELLKKKSSDYSIWLKKSKLFQQKVFNIKQSLQKDVYKVTQSLAIQAKQLNDDLGGIPCSTREADDFIAFYEALIWVTDLLEVRTYCLSIRNIYWWIFFSNAGLHYFNNFTSSLFIEKASDAMKFMLWLCKITIYVSLLFSSKNDILIASKLSLGTPLTAHVANKYWNFFEMIINFFNKPTADFRVFLFFILLNFAQNNTLLNLWNFIFVQFCHIYLTQRYPHFFNFFHLQCSLLLTIGSPSNFILIICFSLVFIPSYCLFILFIRFCILLLLISDVSFSWEVRYMDREYHRAYQTIQHTWRWNFFFQF